MSPARPASAQQGTVVELRDLFYATPARLKFLRSDRAESGAIADVVRRLAMAEPHVGFTLSEVAEGEPPRVIFRADPQNGDFFDALHGRLTRVLGADFTTNALRIEVAHLGVDVERDVRAVHRHIVVEQRLEPPIAPTGDRSISASSLTNACASEKDLASISVST